MKKIFVCALFIPTLLFAQSTADAVDLGLSVKWSTHNLGATESQQTGFYYAWGETLPRENFTVENYKYSANSKGSTIDIGKEISMTAYDASTQLWGSPWRLPSQKEMLELCKKWGPALSV